MTNAANPVVSRDFGRVDAKRAFLFTAILAMVGACYWFALPAVQSLIIPDAPGGAVGPWVVRPILALHAGAMAVMTATTLPFVLRPLRKRWEREDAASGTRYDPFRGHPIKRVGVLFAGFLLLAIYASALMFYLFSWTVIGPDGIDERLPWTTLNHSFGDVESLQTIPNGERSDSIAQNGPWYSIKLRSGRSIRLSHDNEGTTPEELRAMSRFVAKRSGLAWTRRSDARAR